MTSDPTRMPTTGASVGTLRCPKCNSDNIRRSRRHEHGMLRAMLFRGYRCRDCHTRFSRLRLALFAGIAGAALVIAAGIAGGWLLRQYHEPAQQDEPAQPPAEIATGRNDSAPPETTQPAEKPAAAEPAPAEPEVSSSAGPVGNEGLGELAASGQARAQYSLGMSYLNGSGVPKDLTLAFKWFEKSAQQGYADAQYALGSMYLAGRGTLQNFDSAYEWFNKAAQQNHAEAQYRLGIMYRSGHAVPVDKAKAYFWFNLAAAQGHERAAEARDGLLSTLTPEQVTRAQREAQAWKPTPPKQ